MEDEILKVKENFNNFRIPISQEWIESCVEWCKNENLPENYTIKQLYIAVYEQWLLLDLKLLEISTLPAQISSKNKFSLTGTYYLQILYVIDISKPKLWQIQRIRDKVGKNLDIEKDFGKRVLLLTLSDGLHEVQAMEFLPIKELSINLCPGSKIKLTGPIIVRNGVLMLEPRHVKTLGGSVDELLVINAAENILAKALGLKINPNPIHIDEKTLEVPENNITTIAKSVTIPKPAKTEEILVDFNIDEELLKELQEDIIEEEIIPAKKEETIIREPTPDIFEEMEIDDEILDKHFDDIINKTNNIETRKENEIISIDDDSDDDKKKIAEIEAKKIEQSSTTSSQSQEINVITIERLKSIIEKYDKGQFKIKAKFKNVCEKLSVTNNSLNLVINITDSTQELMIKVDSNVAETLAQTTAEKLENLRALSLQNNKSSKTEIIQLLKNLHQNLTKLDNILEVEFSKNEKYPVLRKILD